MFNLDLLATLPPPRDDEPPSLRSDIVDEVLDHLLCAFRREILKDGDEAAAEQRVLARFGDPKKLARRLWWQAMWSRVMGKRILSGLQWLLTLAALVLIGLVIKQQSLILTEMSVQRGSDVIWREKLSQTMNDLRTRLPAPVILEQQPVMMGGEMSGGVMAAMPAAMPPGAGPGMMPAGAAGPMTTKPAALTIKLVQDTADGPPVNQAYVELNGQGHSIYAAPEFQTGTETLPNGAGTFYTGNQNGRFLISSVEPDRYELYISLPDGQASKQPLLIRDAKPRELTVICPPPAVKTSVLITASPVPADLRAQGIYLGAALMPVKQTIDGREWSNSRGKGHNLFFDESTGQLRAADDTDLSQEPPEDRLIFVTAGPFKIHLALSQLLPGQGGARVIAQFELPVNDESPYVATAGENKGDIKVPDEFWETARKELAEGEDQPGEEEHVKESLRGAGIPVNDGGLSLRINDEDHQRPMRGVRVTLHRIGEDRLASPESIASDTTTTQGQVSFSGLARAEVQAIVTLPETNLRSIYTFDLNRPQFNGGRFYGPLDTDEPQEPQPTWDHGYALSVPSRVASAGLTFRTNLPDDLVAAKVKVYFAVASDAVTVNKQEWRYSSGFERVVIGPEGFEGMLQLPHVARNLDQAFLTGRHQVSPAAEWEIRVPALPLRASQLTLICPAKPTQGEDEDAKPGSWRVCARMPVKKQVDNSSDEQNRDEGSSVRIEPVGSESNEWLIDVPEEMIAEARKKLAELDEAK